MQELKDLSKFTTTYRRVTPKFISMMRIPKRLVRKKPNNLQLLKRAKARKEKSSLLKKGKRRRRRDWPMRGMRR